MELRFSGQFNRDIEIRNRKLSNKVRDVILNIKKAPGIAQIHNLVKLRKYKVHYRIQVAKNYRIGVIIRGNKVWLSCFAHRNNFYKKFP